MPAIFGSRCTCASIDCEASLTGFVFAGRLNCASTNKPAATINTHLTTFSNLAFMRLFLQPVFHRVEPTLQRLLSGRLRNSLRTGSPTSLQRFTPLAQHRVVQLQQDRKSVV